ncbi:conserved hypothetical protein [Roseibium sp. TrichSKD4]|nr:conserved hypothetical protein [Roseibium sp. TrichSKD4]
MCALTNHHRDPYPTMAGPHIFDSRVEPVQSLFEDGESKPFCIIYTDYDKNAVLKGNRSRDAANRNVTITFEIYCGIVSQEEEGEYKLDVPVTDSELEITLDIFEDQIFRTLHGEGEAAQAFKSLVHGYESMVSRRGANDEGGKKIAARQITIEANCLRDPIAGAVPSYLADLFDRMEDDRDYEVVASALRNLYADAGGKTAAELTKELLGYPKRVADLLGTPSVALFPSTGIVWFNADGSPLK